MQEIYNSQHGLFGCHLTQGTIQSFTIQSLTIHVSKKFIEHLLCNEYHVWYEVEITCMCPMSLHDSINNKSPPPRFLHSRSGFSLVRFTSLPPTSLPYAPCPLSGSRECSVCTCWAEISGKPEVEGQFWLKHLCTPSGSHLDVASDGN